LTYDHDGILAEFELYGISAYGSVHVQRKRTSWRAKPGKRKLLSRRDHSEAKSAMEVQAEIIWVSSIKKWHLFPKPCRQDIF
jgi:hypothetical protein